MLFKNAKAKFSEPDNTAVFTTTFVGKHNCPITYVTHEKEDGAWQFFSDDNFDNYEDVAMVLSLGEIIKIDSSILELANMPVGQHAVRKSKDHPWTIKTA